MPGYACARARRCSFCISISFFLEQYEEGRGKSYALGRAGGVCDHAKMNNNKGASKRRRETTKKS